jgi:transketolase
MSTAVDADTKTALATAANEARGLAMDSIAAAHSGHMGLPLGCAEIGATLYGSQVRIHSRKYQEEKRYRSHIYTFTN